MAVFLAKKPAQEAEAEAEAEAAKGLKVFYDS